MLEPRREDSRSTGRTTGQGWRPRMELSPSRWLVISFATLIAVGALGFLWLPGLTRQPIGALDAVFMAASAVCVSGLAVIDVGAHLTQAGQMWLMGLVQLGGLGILTFATLIVRAIGRRASLEAEEAASAGAGLLARAPRELLRAVLVTTFAAETLGALALWLLWGPRLGWLDAAWPALFHSISAFCNAGFSTFSDGLTGFASSPLTLAVLASLVIVGGIGFPVLEDLRLSRAGRRKRLGLSTRVTLVATAVLLGGGSALFLLFELDAALAPLDWIDRVANAVFMAVTPRSAGFNSVDYAEVTNASYLLTLLLMWIGGSPVSTAGGVKTTAVALLVLAVWSRLRGQEHVTIGARTIPHTTVARALGLALTFVVLLVVATLALLATESTGSGANDRQLMARILFEAQSAIGTGLSMGLTSQLSDAGRLIVVLCMFIGRVGPIAILDALSRAPVRKAIRYAREDVLVG